MDNTPKTIINYSVKVETRDWIDDFAQSTDRSQGNVVDFLVSVARRRAEKAGQETKTVEEAISEGV
jgi:hypothetical protein